MDGPAVAAPHPPAIERAIKETVMTAHTARPTVRATITDRGFVVHYLQMLAAMGVGMLVLGPLSMLVDAGIEIDSLLMATWMTAGMTAWMAWRGHPWPAIAEMGLAMYASFVVLFPAYWLGLLSGHDVMLAGHLLMLPAMALAMLHRREEYVRD
jgi:flagellar biosynthetic protein FliP